MTSQQLLPDHDIKGTAGHYCPFLGIPGDATTHYQYPSRINHCHVPDRPEPIQFDHQQAFCLSSQYVQCPVYRQEGAVNLPPEIRGKNYSGSQPGSRKNAGVIVGVIGLGVIIGLAGFLLSPLYQQSPLYEQSPLYGQSPLSSAVSLQPSQTPEAPSLTPSPFPLFTFSPTTSPLLPTATPSPTNTPTQTPAPPTFTPTYFPTPGPGFGTPFGTNPQFVIHIVQAGESFTAIAALYDTTPEVLEAINKLKEGQSLWAGRPIVVPLGVTDPAGLPRFEVYLLPENTTLAALAALFNADPELIRLYNALGPQPEIPAGRWLIIPLPAE